MTITLDSTTETFVRLLREHLDAEPPLPNENMPHDYANAVAREYSQWDRVGAAYRVLIGVRLTKLALEES